MNKNKVDLCMATLKFEESLKELQCVSCNYSLAVPYHCGRQMLLESDKLICWKGEHQPCCNSTSTLDIPTHHEENMVLKSQNIKFGG